MEKRAADDDEDDGFLSPEDSAEKVSLLACTARVEGARVRCSGWKESLPLHPEQGAGIKFLQANARTCAAERQREISVDDSDWKCIITLRVKAELRGTRIP